MDDLINDKVFSFDELDDNIFKINVTAWSKFYNKDYYVEWKEEMPLGLPLDNVIAAVVDENGQPMGLDQEEEIVGLLLPCLACFAYPALRLLCIYRC